MERNPDCPSDLWLDRLVTGGLDAGQDMAARGHVEACERCGQELAMRRKGFAAFPNVDAPVLAERIAARLAEVGPRSRDRAIEPRRAPWLRWPSFAGAGVLAAAALLVTVQQAQRFDEGREEVVRAKGRGTRLHVFRLQDDGARELASGVRLSGGDELRFGVDIPEAGQGIVVGVEASGRLYAAFPAGGTTSRPLAAGDGQLLPGAIRLDDSSGSELLVLIVCPRAFALEDLRPAQGGVATPEGCLRDAFALSK